MEFILDEVSTANKFKIKKVGSTLENLVEASAGENYETKIMYPEFEKIARQENFRKIADIFKEIGEVEEKHEERYLKLADLLKNNALFESSESVEWKCLNCGYIHKGNTPPQICPACGKPHSYYMQLNILR